MDSIDAILEELGLLPAARAVYLSLLRDGEATARVIAKRTGITRPSVYDQVHDLRNKGLVVERDRDGKTYFGATDVRQVSTLLEDRMERLDMGKQLLAKSLDTLLAEGHTVQPKIRFFEGREGVQQMMKDILWYDNIALAICWPYQHVVNVLGGEYLEWFNKKRVTRHIGVRTIWTDAERALKDHVFTGADTLVQRRYAKKGQRFAMAYLVYEDNVLFVSSAKEAFGFHVQSHEFAELMLVQFETLWSMAKK